jgi:hypothetical protein
VKPLAKVERKLASKARREELANCICKEVTLVLPDQAEEFEAEMNQTCPALDSVG